mmetsp:Transcript_9724/g.24307  ORF Transcript_9724/g.24307 Transcript_9724/m.24307 type:complete len:235 (-) Transcript_9724:2106-2810(-)
MAHKSKSTWRRGGRDQPNPNENLSGRNLGPSLPLGCLRFGFLTFFFSTGFLGCLLRFSLSSACLFMAASLMACAFFASSSRNAFSPISLMRRWRSSSSLRRLSASSALRRVSARLALVTRQKHCMVSTAAWQRFRRSTRSFMRQMSSMTAAASFCRRYSLRLTRILYQAWMRMITTMSLAMRRSSRLLDTSCFMNTFVLPSWMWSGWMPRWGSSDPADALCDVSFQCLTSTRHL